MSPKLPVEVHPVANIFPMMAADEFDGLKKDIEANGVREPLTMWNGQLIDGRNRMAACIELGIDWECHLCELDNDQDPVAYVISHNLHRRHLTTSQRARVAEKLFDIFAEKAKENQKAGGKAAGNGREKVMEILPEPTVARDAAGAALNVSGKLVDAARTVTELGCKALNEAVDAGEVSVSKAAKVAKAHDKKSQMAALNEKPQKPRQPERTVFTRLRELFDDMSKAERAQAALMWEAWLDET